MSFQGLQNSEDRGAVPSYGASSRDEAEPIAPRDVAGNTYDRVIGSGNSRMHLGNQYGDRIQNKFEFNVGRGWGAKEEASQAKLHDQVLDLLEFHGMNERLEDISAAHKGTFQWIYERTDLGFVPWLRQHRGVFWITGKAGSGKSTLTKFLFNDPRTQQFLEPTSLNLLIAGFFFHDRGSNPLLKSQLGLYRAILHQVLSRHKILTSIVLPRVWRKIKSWRRKITEYQWTVSELQDAFKALVTQKVVKLHLFLIIDGLDEFSGHPEEIVTTLNNLLQTQDPDTVRVQLCVSSRPLPVFEQAYTNYTHLKMQELTYGDIRSYVTSKFEEVALMQDVMKLETSKMNEIISEILKKSSGIFLWVFLVVRSLIEGIKGYDTIANLQRRLSALPPGLEPLYERMVQNIDPFYHSHASEIFQIVQCAVLPLSPLAMSYAEEISEIVTNSEELQEMAENIPYQLKLVEKHLKHRCAGLVEITNTSGDDTDVTEMQVQFLHLTMKEFMASSSMQLWLSSKSPSAKFNPHKRIVSSCLRQLQVTKSLDFYRNLAIGSPRPDIDGLRENRSSLWTMSNSEGMLYIILFHAKESEKRLGISLLRFLNTLNDYMETRIKWRRHWTTSRHIDWPEPEDWESDFVSFLVQLGLTQSVLQMIANGYVVSKKPGRPLILYAFGSKLFDDPLLFDPPLLDRQHSFDLDLVELLLRNDDNPNLRFPTDQEHNDNPKTP